MFLIKKYKKIQWYRWCLQWLVTYIQVYDQLTQTSTDRLREIMIEKVPAMATKRAQWFEW